MRQNLLQIGMAGQLGPGLVTRLATHQCLGLGEEIGQQDPMVTAIASRVVVALDRGQEIAWNETCSLFKVNLNNN